MEEESNLIGDIRFSETAIYDVKKCQELLIEIEAVMTKYKAVKIDVAFDYFKLKK